MYTSFCDYKWQLFERYLYTHELEDTAANREIFCLKYQDEFDQYLYELKQENLNEWRKAEGD